MMAKGNRGVNINIENTNARRMSARQAGISGPEINDPPIKLKPNSRLEQTGSSVTMTGTKLTKYNNTTGKLHKDLEVPNRGKEIEGIEKGRDEDGKRDTMEEDMVWNEELSRETDDQNLPLSTHQISKNRLTVSQSNNIHGKCSTRTRKLKLQGKEFGSIYGG